jgi:hypothetical protein
MAKKRMVPTKLMKVEVTATGSGTPKRRIVYIVIGADPELSGVMNPAQAPMPPARISPLSGGWGNTCRAQTHSRSPPPIQSREARPSPRSTQPQWIRPTPAKKAPRLFP